MVPGMRRNVRVVEVEMAHVPATAPWQRGNVTKSFPGPPAPVRCKSGRGAPCRRVPGKCRWA